MMTRSRQATRRSSTVARTSRMQQIAESTISRPRGRGLSPQRLCPMVRPLLSLALATWFAATASSRVVAEVLYGSTYYTAPVASSEYSELYPVTALFDNDADSPWVIAGEAGNNPQGREQGWVSFVLDQTYSIEDILFAPRSPSGQPDGIDTLRVWIGTTSFGVDVTSGASTSAFLSSLTGQNPTWSHSNFTSDAVQTYPLAQPVTGRYVLAEFINTTDTNTFRNLGGRELVVNAVAVPEPTVGGLAAAAVALVALVRRTRRPTMLSRVADV